MGGCGQARSQAAPATMTGLEHVTLRIVGTRGGSRNHCRALIIGSAFRKRARSLRHFIALRQVRQHNMGSEYATVGCCPSGGTSVVLI